MIATSISECLLMLHPAVYRIRVSGRMDPKWSDYLQGMTLTVIEEPGREILTEISGLLPDQAALMGVIDQLYNRNIPLLSVECVSYGLEKTAADSIKGRKVTPPYGKLPQKGGKS